MPAGPEQHIAANELPDYPTFRQRLIADCHRLDATVPSERLIRAEYEHRRQVLDSLRAAELEWQAQERGWGR
jgi:hypothetical protein